MQLRAGDLATFGRMAENTMDKLARSKTGEVLSWCPSCQVQFTEMTLPTVEKTRGAKPFEMTPFMLFLRRHLDRMRPLLRERVPMRIALHRHPGVHGVVEAAEEILSAVPGIEVVDLQQPAVGLQANNLRVLPQYRRSCRSTSLRRPRPQASTRWSRSIIPIIANCARTSATGRSASSIFWKSSVPAWGCIMTIISSG